MTEDITVELTFSVADPELEDEERNAIALQLLRQMRQLDEVERVDRSTEDLSPEADSRAGLATLLGFLTVEVSCRLGGVQRNPTPAILDCGKITPSSDHFIMLWQN